MTAPDLPTPDDVVITRETGLAISADELWALVGQGEHWSEWLVDEADIHVSEGANGTVTIDGEHRLVTVRRVREGEHLQFEWWGDDAPRTTVDLEVMPAGRGSVLRVSERLSAPPSASMSATTANAAPQARRARAWDLRLLVLCLQTAALVRT